MADLTVALNCTNCGARLEISDSMDVFACGYCGTTMQVRRSGGTISLEAVVEVLGKVHSVSKKTASELALTRLKAEHAELSMRASELAGANDSRTGCFALFGVVLLAFGTLIFASGPSNAVGAVGLVLVTIGVYILVRAYASSGNKEATEIKRRIAAINEQISSHLAVVNSPE